MSRTYFKLRGKSIWFVCAESVSGDPVRLGAGETPRVARESMNDTPIAANAGADGGVAAALRWAELAWNEQYKRAWLEKVEVTEDARVVLSGKKARTR